MKQKKRRYLLSPCRDWDIPGLESWLEDMSMMGWTFKWTRLGGLLFEFWETVPHPVKFRMEPVQKIHGRFADAPEPDQQRFYEGFGWKFICRHGAFFLYRNEDPAAPELNTDPQVQALTMDYLKKSVRRGLVTTMLITFPLLLLFISHFFLFSDYLSGTIYTFLFCSFYFFSIMDYWILFFQTEKLRKKLKNGIPMTHRKNWHPGSFIHRAGKVTMLLSCFVLVFAALNARFALNHTPLEQWTEPIPFVTYTELAPESSNVTIQRVSNGYVRYWSDLLMPVNYEWLDGGSYQYPESKERARILEVRYHETASPFIAKQLASSYRQFYYLRYQSHSVEYPELGFDYAAGYHTQYGLDLLVIQHGKICICIELGGGTDHFTTENWAKLMADQLLDSE